MARVRRQQSPLKCQTSDNKHHLFTVSSSIREVGPKPETSNLLVVVSVPTDGAVFVKRNNFFFNYDATPFPFVIC